MVVRGGGRFCGRGSLRVLSLFFSMLLVNRVTVGGLAGGAVQFFGGRGGNGVFDGWFGPPC